MGSKGKGSGEERNVCRLITKWMTGVEDPVVCWRSSNSGGTFTVNRKKKAGQNAMAGDLCSIDAVSKWFFDKFTVECKCGYPGANPLKLFKDSKKDELRSFWIQANDDANQSGKTAILMFKQNQGKRLIGLNSNMVNKFKFDLKPAMHIKFSEKYNLPELILFEADAFFEKYPVNTFKSLLGVE